VSFFSLSRWAVTNSYRGGRADFKWEDVKQDTQRENYLGHSLMARKFYFQSYRCLQLLITGSCWPMAERSRPKLVFESR
jgi:Multiple myeloma tumor-associated